MPNVNGVEVIRHLKAHYPTVPFIVLTANPDFLLTEILAKDGVCDYLIKPISKEKALGIGPGRRQIAPVAQGPVSEFMTRTRLTRLRCRSDLPSYSQ